MAPRALSALAVCLLITTVAAGGAAAPTATITAAESQSIPEQELTIEGTTFTPDTVSVKDTSDQLELDISVSNDATYRVAVYNTAEQIVTQERRSAETTVTFDMSGYTAGTYLVAVVQDGTFLAVHPLIVRSYVLDADVPSTADADGSVSVSIDSEQQREPTAEYIEVVVTNGEERVQKQVQQTEGSLTTSVDVSALPAGEYEVYATARGATDAYGEAEFLGITAGQSIELTRATATRTDAPATDSPTPTPTAATSTPSTTTPATATQTTTPATATSTPETATATSEDTPTRTTAPDASTPATPSPTAQDVVTPNDTTATPQAEQPGFGVLALLGALVAVVVVTRRRRR